MVALTVLGITFGAMVTSTGSGMAFTDWPTSDGGWMPERALETLPGFLEHFHRLIFASVGFLMLLLTVWVWLAKASPSLRKLCVYGLVLVIVQGVFGGVGVLLNTPAWTSVTHGVLAQITLSVFAVLLASLTPAWVAIAPAAGVAPEVGRKITRFALFMVVLQTVLGAIARHSGNELAKWTHVGNSLVVFLAVIIAAGVASGRLGHVPGIKRLSRTLLTLLVVQLILGFVALLETRGKQPENIDHLWSCSLISAHVLTGALLTLTSTMLMVTVYRATRPAT